MSIAVATPPIRNGGTNMMQNNRQPTTLNEIARRIRALRALSQVSNYSTNRTVGEMLDHLTADELVTVGELLMLNPSSTQEENK